jgi:hypothetical protein
MGRLNGQSRTVRGKLPLVLLGILAVGGCATGQKIGLTYEAVPAEGMVKAPNVTVGVGAFEDQRDDPEVIGEIRRGLWGSTVRPDEKIRPQQGSAASWVRDALLAELRLRGYNVVEASAKPEWLVRGSILELFYSEGGWPITRPGAVITVECELVHNERILFVEQYWSSTTASGRPGDAGGMLERVLRRDLRKFLADFEAQREGAAENG